MLSAQSGAVQNALPGLFGPINTPYRVFPGSLFSLTNFFRPDIIKQDKAGCLFGWLAAFFLLPLSVPEMALPYFGVEEESRYGP